MEQEIDKFEKMDKLARGILVLSRDTLLVNMRFMDMALSQFKMELSPFHLATDGINLYYDPTFVLRQYKENKNNMIRHYLHVVFHCVFRHLYFETEMNERLWNLACDMAAEQTVLDLNMKQFELSNDAKKRVTLSKIQSEIKYMNAEKIYRYLIFTSLTEHQLLEMEQLFLSDDHSVWYLPHAASVTLAAKSNDSASGGATSETSSSDKGSGSSGDEANQPGRAEMKEFWKKISERMQVDMDTFGKQRGNTPGNLVQALNQVNREKYDYTSFLKKFAVMSEVMKINDDEFDYVFYTYGLKLFKNMPLIEPLEYKDEKRIKEFVIAIDTSGSTSGELVQKFLNKTFNILKSLENFHTRINLHIIQCDADIQEDAKITNQSEFDEYLKTMTIKGLGGTDFRPVFEYVDKLIDRKEFTNLKGMIYFTDGWGVFPSMKPDYHTAFVFIDDDYNNPEVPPWAIKLVLQSEEID